MFLFSFPPVEFPAFNTEISHFQLLNFVMIFSVGRKSLEDLHWRKDDQWLLTLVGH